VTGDRFFAPDAVWILPGRGPMAGVHRGVAEIHANFFARLGPLSGGTFRAELLDVAVGEDLSWQSSAPPRSMTDGASMSRVAS
jgi:hypothetical protein